MSRTVTDINSLGTLKFRLKRFLFSLALNWYWLYLRPAPLRLRRNSTILIYYYYCSGRALHTFTCFRGGLLQRRLVTRIEDLCAACTKYPAPTTLSWLSHPLGRQYFLAGSWSQLTANSSFTSCVNERQFLAFAIRLLTLLVWHRNHRVSLSVGVE